MPLPGRLDCENVAARDKLACKRHYAGTIKAQCVTCFGSEDYGCGLCQTGVPCEDCNSLESGQTG